MIDIATYLGPATVTSTEGKPDHVRIELPEGERAWARLALAVPYRPAEGDEVLVIGHEPAYVIGLLRGRGEITLRAPGALTIEAALGPLTLSSPAGVRIRSENEIEAVAPQVTIRAGRLETVAHRIVEKTREFYGWIADLFHLDAQRVKATAHSDLDLRGERASLRAQDTVTVDGKSIHLG